jgi:putative flavoprotein involved in K+ transport
VGGRDRERTCTRRTLEHRVNHVVIIGAGPAGLAAAAALARRDIAYTLLERGDRAASALRTVDPAMSLFSPTRLSKLHDMTLEPAARYATFGELVGALEQFRETHRLVVTPDQTVTGVVRDGDRFVVRTAANAFEASHVINATGIVGSPRFPAEVDRSVLNMRWMHSVDVRRADVAAARNVVVVGAGASAAEVLSHWLADRRPGDRASIAVRSGLHAMPSSLLGLDMHYWVWAIEHLPGRPFGPWLAPRDAMWGTKVAKPIRRGEVTQVAIERYEPDRVVLRDGSAIEPDLLVFATGFTHDTRHLGELVERDAADWPIARRAESRRTPGMFVLGSRYARSLASPTIRGIARDAEAIAKRIAS